MTEILTHEQYIAMTDDEWEDWEPYNRNDPRSLINIVPSRLSRLISQVPKDWYSLSESEIESLAKPTVNDKRIRMAFWHEYEHAQSQMRNMRISNISLMSNISELAIYKNLSSPEKMMYTLTAPVSYSLFLEEASAHGLQRLRDDILTIDIYDEKIDPETGEKIRKVNASAANLLLKAIAFVDLRKHGGIVQKNLHIHSDTTAMRSVSSHAKSLEDLDARIKELEAEGVTLDSISIPDENS